MIILPFLPASNLFFPVGFVVAERILYIPSMGYCLLVSLGYYSLKNYMTVKKSVLKVLMISILVLYGMKCYLRNEDWKTEESIFLAGLKVSKSNAKLWNNVGHALESRMSHEEALKFFKQATFAQEDDVGAHINVGRTLNHLNRYEEAEVIHGRSAKRHIC